ncbi:MAG: hypothetical protein JOY93_01760, partial [Acidobacteriales bacterium]|nr:hypothetical protein [Terriglobales bacterium]
MAEGLKIVSRESDTATATLASPQLVRHKSEENDFAFAVTVGEIYQGPLDLLLDLIRKQDIDIYDIP